MDNTDQQVAQPLRVDVTLDEMEKSVKSAEDEAKQAAEAAKAQAAREAAAAAAPLADDPKVAALKEALRLSEESRQRLQSQLGQPAAQPAAPQEKELTEEELAELYEKKPIEAIRYMQERATKAVEENISRRLTPLLSGSATAAEEHARRKYPDEFKVFDREIAEYVSSHPNKQVFSNPQTWDDFIAWMRGKPGNFEKIMEHRAAQKKDSAAADAQALQVASAGAHTRSETRAPAPRSDGAFDETEREIIKELAASGILDASDPEADYRRWRVTRR